MTYPVPWTERLAWYFGLIYLTRPVRGWYLDLHRLLRIRMSDRMYVNYGHGWTNGIAMVRLWKTKEKHK
jgi:hypothetical protein